MVDSEKEEREKRDREKRKRWMMKEEAIVIEW